MPLGPPGLPALSSGEQSLVGAALLGLVAGVASMALGGIISVIRRPGPASSSFLLGFAGGVMLGIVAMDLVPASVSAGGAALGMAGIAAGLAFVPGLDLTLPRRRIASRFLRSGILEAISIGMHNGAEGLAIGSGLSFIPNMGLRVALLMGLHTLLEGVAVTESLRLGGTPAVVAVAWSALAGVPMVAGSCAGWAFGEVSNAALSLCLGAAGGVMLAVVARQLVPDGLALSKRIHHAPLGVTLGFLTGALLIAWT